MPNICLNRVKLIGSRGKIQEFKDRFIRLEDGEQDFSFNYVMPMPTDNDADMQMLRQLYGNNSYNEWRNLNWNTKWDATCIIIEESNGMIEMTFDTAWEAPYPVMNRVSELISDLQVIMMSEVRDSNFAGIVVYLNGESIVDMCDSFDNLSDDEAAEDMWDQLENPYTQLYNQYGLKAKKHSKKYYNQCIQSFRYKHLNVLKKLSRKQLIQYLRSTHCRIRIGQNKKSLFNKALKAQITQNTYQQNCSTCLNKLHKPVQLKCYHIFCKDCIDTWIQSRIRCQQRPNCPLCRIEF